MGNQQSDYHEEQAFNLIQEIPIVNMAYGSVRAAVYSCKGDNARATQSLTRSFVGPLFPSEADRIEREKIEGPLATVWKSSEEILPFARIGDLLEFNYTLCGHYALYIGDGNVMNVYANRKKDFAALIGESTIDQTCEWLKTNQIRIRNHDHVARNQYKAFPRSRDDMVAAANQMKGLMVEYKYNLQNSEFYTTLWRYGIGFSTQVARPTSSPGDVFMPPFILPIGDSAGFAFVPTANIDEFRVFDAYKKASAETNKIYY